MQDDSDGKGQTAGDVETGMPIASNTNDAVHSGVAGLAE